jgi:ABC-2 type transport system ATP-binding protein
MTDTYVISSEEVPMSAGGDAPAIELVRLSKTYGRGAPAVDDVSLRIAAGEVLALLGPNGAGKTTTIKMLCGLVSPTSGTARVLGHDVTRQRRQAVRRIGAVLEGSRNVYWSLSAWQNLLYFGRLKGLRATEIKPRAERLLYELGLWERRGELVGSYSRGMQQKVAVAAALVTDPPVVLLDEPTIGLDVEAARTVKDWVRRLAREQGKTVLLSTHQLAMAEELADRVAVIRAGRIVADLPTAALLDRYAEQAYDIQIAGRFPKRLANATVHSGDGQTRILLPTDNIDDLYTLLARLHAYELPLVSVNRVRPSLEDVFVRLVGEGS